MEGNYLKNIGEKLFGWFDRLISGSKKPLTIEDKFNNAERITLERLKKSGYSHYRIVEEIAARADYRVHPSDVHLVGFNPAEKVLFYRVNGIIHRARFHRPENIRDTF
jgi:hypothetical protein